jgi:sirohydrochlorin cobaltochelatase
MQSPLVITAFGTSSRAVATYARLDDMLRHQFGGQVIHWAWSSQILAKKSHETNSKTVMHLEELFNHLKSRGVKKTTVQSLHLFPGKEFHDLCRTVEQSGLQCRVGMPLLTSPRDYIEVAEILGPEITASRAEAALIIGHGTDHPIWVAYHSLEKIFNDVLAKKIYVGVVEKFPDSSHLIEKIAADGVKTICLVPLFLVAGMHFYRDIVNPARDSWQSKLLSRNIEVEIIETGLGLLPGIENLIGRHIREAKPLR